MTTKKAAKPELRTYSKLYEGSLEAEKLGQEFMVNLKALPDFDAVKDLADEMNVKTTGHTRATLQNKLVRGVVAARVNAEANLTVEDLAEYDYIIVAFSGGKDSLVCFLHLLDIGVPLAKIELWHHDVDGREGSTMMDWSCTRAYCQAFADAFGVPIYFSWKKGGFEREMLRENELTQPTSFEVPGGEVVTVGGTQGKPNTRRMFPQVSSSLSDRWCSSYLKISVCGTALNNQARFLNKKTIMLTGERAQESSNRAHYAKFEKHSSNCQGKRKTRVVHQYRPVHSWKEEKVWELIEKYRINPHPAYKLGWGRVSCQPCIFGNRHQWASIAKISPEKVALIIKYEEEFGKTIQRDESVPEMIAKGTAYDMKDEDIKAATSFGYDQPIILPEGEEWVLPAGAFSDGCGPT